LLRVVRKKVAFQKPITVDDITNTTCADDNTSRSQLHTRDSGLFFRTFDLQLNSACEDAVDGAIFMEIDERDYTFDGN